MTVGTRPSWTFDAIGTRWEILTDLPLDADARAAVTALIEEFDRDWSRFRPDSLVARLARSGGDAKAPGDTTAMLDAYGSLSAASGGAVNPLVGDALARRGYGMDYTLSDAGATAAPAAWAELLSWDDDVLTLHAPATIDVGALGKGRLVDRVLARLATDLDGTIVVDASGDLAVRGGPLRVGLEHPYDRSRAIGVAEVTDGALCASATNRRTWGNGLHHVVDARTGEPVRTVAATWARARDAMRADAIATALFFDGGPELAHQWNVDWVRMRTDGRVEWSAGAEGWAFR